MEKYLKELQNNFSEYLMQHPEVLIFEVQEKYEDQLVVDSYKELSTILKYIK